MSEIEKIQQAKKILESKDGTINIYNGNCYELLPKLIKDGVKVDAIIIDPPYEIDYAEWDKEQNWRQLFELFAKITKPDANIIIFQGWSSVCNTIANIPPNMTLKNWIIYDRIKGRGGKTNVVSTREDILWIVKDKNKYTFNKIPSSIKKKTGGLGLKNGCELRALSNVWTDISPIVPWSKERVNHPTQKPIQLMERCVRLWTNEGDIVLDCFSGSGTTAVACYNTKRRFICIEKDYDYWKASVERLKMHKHK